jgi:hypothetical protein
MERMIKYPSTPQFREVVQNIKFSATYVGQDENGEAIFDSSRELPKVKFYGTPKLHGTNASVVWDVKRDIFWTQSRENIITPTHDNAGFSQFAYSKQDIFKTMIKRYFTSLEKEYNIKYNIEDYIVTLYGEWAGKGIQRGVGISEIPKSFFIFGLKLTPNYTDSEESSESAFWVPCDYTSCVGHGDVLILNDGNNNIWNIGSFKGYQIEIDFNNLNDAVEEMTKLTEEVEAECPVAKEFGIENSLGEGIVWTGFVDGIRYIFKIKGEKHSSSKVKKIVEVDVEKMNSVDEFIEYAVTENRLNQGIEQVFTSNSEIPDITKTGKFIKWILNDIIKEELDVLTASGLEVKEVSGAISAKAVKWYKQYLMKF